MTTWSVALFTSRSSRFSSQTSCIFGPMPPSALKSRLELSSREIELAEDVFYKALSDNKYTPGLLILNRPELVPAAVARLTEPGKIKVEDTPKLLLS